MKRLIALVLLLFAQTAHADSATDWLWSLTPAPSPQLGVAFPGKDPQYYPLMSEAGIGVARIGVNWRFVEPRPGEFRFRALDERIAALDALQITPFITFYSDADWAVIPTDNVKNAAPRDMAQWARFVGTVAARYSGDGKGPALRQPVQYYQVANEFLSDRNRSGGWDGTPQDLISYINTAHDAVKAAAPEATFVLGGIASMNLDAALLAMARADYPVQQRWKDGSKTVVTPELLAQPDIQENLLVTLPRILAEARYDIADAHLYGSEARDELRMGLLAELSGRRVLSSECGGPSLDYDRTYTGQGHYHAVIWRNLNVLSAGGDFCTWFGLGEGLGATYGNTRVPLYTRDIEEKPGVQAYRLLATLLAGGAEVTRDGPALFTIATQHGPVHVAVAPEAFAALPDAAPIICIQDAETQTATVTTARALQQICPSDGVALSGAALLENQ